MFGGGAELGGSSSFVDRFLDFVKRRNLWLSLESVELRSMSENQYLSERVNRQIILMMLMSKSGRELHKARQSIFEQKYVEFFARSYSERK